MHSTVNSAKNGWPWLKAAVTPNSVAFANPPRISIITPSFNQGQFLEETIRSILLQDYPNLEFVIMDGGSTDNSVDIIKKYADRITYWESGKDRGQSHAINKGIARCTGEIFNWINSDDLLMPGALWTVAKVWREKPGQIVSGHTEFFDNVGPLQLIRADGQTLRNFIRFWEADGWGWAQPGTFVPLNEVKKIHGVQENLKYCFDYHMMVRLLANGVTVTHLDQTLARFRLHNVSKTVGSKEEFRLERIPVLRSMKDIPIKVEDWEWDHQQVKRLVDVGFSATRRGKTAAGFNYLRRALSLSPLETTRVILRRLRDKARRSVAQQGGN